MAIAYVQSVSIDADATPATTPAFGSSVTSGSLIVVCCVGDGGNVASVTGVTDSNGNTYTQIPGSSFGNGNNMVAYMTVVSAAGAGNVVYVAFNDASENMRVIAQNFNGFVGTPTLDQIKNATGSSTAPASGASSTTSFATELVIGMLAKDGNSASTITAGAGYSNLATNSGASVATVQAGMESTIVSATGGQNATFTLSVTRPWLAQVITFYDNTGGGPTGPSGPSGPAYGNFMMVF